MGNLTSECLSEVTRPASRQDRCTISSDTRCGLFSAWRKITRIGGAPIDCIMVGYKVYDRIPGMLAAGLQGLFFIESSPPNHYFSQARKTPQRKQHAAPPPTFTHINCTPANTVTSTLFTNPILVLDLAGHCGVPRSRCLHPSLGFSAHVSRLDLSTPDRSR